MTNFEDHYRKLEERRLRGVHRWDYPHPINLWESWPWWFRWPAAAAIAVYFIGGLIAGVVGLGRL